MIRARRLPYPTVAPHQYVCSRCGAIRQTRAERTRPPMCRDCQEVELAIRALAQCAADEDDDEAADLLARRSA